METIKKNYTRCYIAFLDILGFKELVKTKDCSIIYDIYSQNMKKPLGGFYHGTIPVLNMQDIKMKVMSDSICFYIDSSKTNSLVGLIVTCLHFQSDLLRLHEPILTRGAITCGDIFADGDIIFGPGFVKAYLMEENNAKYPRIILTKETINHATNNTEEEIRDYIPQHVFCDYDEFYTIDYFEEFEGFDTTGEYCSYLLEYIDKVLATTLDNSIREKYLYLKHNLLRWYKPSSAKQDLNKINL